MFPIIRHNGKSVQVVKRSFGYGVVGNFFDEGQTEEDLDDMIHLLVQAREQIIDARYEESMDKQEER
jgi:NCAIR mutase (PurE)-related protein